MKCLITTILLALAPLSWGEDVWYCAEEHHVALEPADSVDAYEIRRHKPDLFYFKYDATYDRLVIHGWRDWEDDVYYMECSYCIPEASFFRASETSYSFFLKGRRFQTGNIRASDSSISTGTCEKF